MVTQTPDDLRDFWSRDKKGGGGEIHSMSRATPMQHVIQPQTAELQKGVLSE